VFHISICEGGSHNQPVKRRFAWIEDQNYPIKYLTPTHHR